MEEHMIGPRQVILSILEVGVTSHAQIRHIVLGCLASLSLFIMFNLCACNVWKKSPYNYENFGKYITLSGQHHIWILKFNYDRFVWQRDLKSV